MYQSTPLAQVGEGVKGWMEQVRCSGAAMYQGAAGGRPGNDCLKAWAKFGGINNRRSLSSASIDPSPSVHISTCYVGRRLMEYVVLRSVSYFCAIAVKYREVNKGLSMVARNFFLLLLNCSAWPCLGPA